ncbi:unnamed protein product [Mytilus coruscus]|uniref:Uncharacterized protein n=1 Tax=Mytilus coruscus TaxID=42192 RepID=A0A6J8AEY9_MYTCO|nr:unnamed protein product [Mytilus coruscus]
MAFIQAGLSEFNNDDMDGFRARAWRIVSGNAKQDDFAGTFPHACLTHVMASFRKVALEHYNTNFEFGMYCFSLILNSVSLKKASQSLIAVYYVLSSKVLDQKTIHIQHMNEINLKISNFPIEIESIENCYEDTYTNEDQSIFAENINPDHHTEEDFLNRSTINEFSHWSKEILQNVHEEIDESIFVEVQGNKRYSTTIADKIQKLFMPTFPLWSNLLLGDLSRNGMSDVYSSFKIPNKIERGNSGIEKRFQVLKDKCVL